MKILTLGPRGTFSHKASLDYVKKNKLKDVDIDFCNNITEIFNVVEKAKQEDVLGIVPVENMLNGSVGETLDLLFRKKVFVIGEIIIFIHHCLASKEGIKDINELIGVISHPQALGQCMNFIRENNLETKEEVSTANAMQKIANSDKRDYGALGTEIAAKEYSLRILKKNIEDNLNNVTRFFVISGKPQNIKESQNCKTSLAIHPNIDRPGLLLDLLKTFSLRKINLTKIESRPTKANLGEYIFYIDFDGNKDDKKSQEAIEEIKKLGEVKIFGSYKKNLDRL